ncbi:MBL fold metallo-hydrolase [Clostridium sporogenes]|uniref:MBL fold metallo-hydrolase n=1 Tax=Clostridium sporogenes TaxID=1509 RepID=UPI0013D73017|nr:MBL fold metallo-hydrolase [Clostridium sporogenes]NFG95633.1 MBL fold metallo-hydrolase [Clostridium sporogenes]NFH32724.1 MBL fold metallo-hydrolase [Clostridium sporogenes]NFL18878.1 MBL fold metallo-hydrolase [Clostridium sporogenes]NFN71880.1 MBL fold metallo-hydrolase [Clostridium sporogenes]NFV21270.1 MBL fold metallo-hydrolase [Clostridium sporogenes]
MRETYENIYLEELPLPNNPLKYLNFYIIKGKDKSMIIDTGFNREDTKERMIEIFKKLDLEPEKTILFLTHLHSDHTGLATYFQDMGLTVYISKIDGDLLNGSVEKSGPMWEGTIQRAMWQGLEEEQLDIEDNPGFKFRPISHINFVPAIPGEYIQIGDYNFEIIDLRGHTPGMVGLYEKKHKILFCGDHILGKITPNITFWGFEYGDMLGTYFKSLDFVYNMDIDYLFSSHRFLIEDHRKRINELHHHHEKRLDEIREVLRKFGPCTVKQVTKELHWDIKSKSWDEFPKSQKWFAAGEAHAHLEHLRALGEVTMEEKNRILYYKMRLT